MDAATVRQLVQQAEAFCFDVDSTVIQEEGIDVLAESCGVGEEVAAWTRQAMGGGVTFQEALSARLSIMKPSRQQLEECLTKHPVNLTPGVSDLVVRLQQAGKQVHLVSGGFRQMIYPVADTLHIPHTDVYANNLLFDDVTGAFAGFDPNEPTSRSGGKKNVVEMLMTQRGYQTVVMVGDGVTDMEAKPPAALFIGFGGNVVRESVRSKADFFAMSMQDIIDLLS